MKKIFLVLFLFIFGLNLLLIPGQQSIIDLKRIVVKMGHLKFKNDIPVKYFDRKALTQYIEKLFDEEYTDRMVEKDELFLQLFGFLNEPVDLKKVRKEVILSNIGGLYNEKTKELYVLDEYKNIDLINSLIIVHELRHSIQDQHYNLSRILGEHSDFDDRKIAALSAIEGDATLIMVLYAGLNPEVLASSFNAEALMSFSPIGNTNTLHNAPEIVKYQLIVPYIEGLKFVNTILKRKKWKGVNKILVSPPASTEQILHPEKYLKGELPFLVKIGYKPDGYALVHSGVVGEFYLNVLLKPGDNYKDIASGWGGDTFKIYKNSKFYFLLWESVWDKDKYCARFFVVFTRFLEKRYGVKFRKGNIKGFPFIAGDSDEGYFFMNVHKNRIFYVRSNDRKQINSFINGGYYD